MAAASSGQMHPAAHRSVADPLTAAEDRRDQAHPHKIGGTTHPLKGALGLDDQITLVQEAHPLGDPHGHIEGAARVDLLRDQQGRHPPDHLQLARHLQVAGDRQDRGAGAELADVASGRTALGERQDRGGVELAGDAADRLTDGVGDGGRHVAGQHPLGIVALDAAGDLGHGGHGLHRIVADGALVGEHHGIGAIEDGIGHITHLGPGGAGAAHH
jgi:hypothetical protein